MAILVTGGAGYIGSHTVAELVAHGEDVVVIDNLGQGHREAVLDATFYPMDIRDEEGVTEIIRKHDVESVIHFAANSLVGESVQNPLKYYRNNIAATEQLLSVLVSTGVKNVVFSSTAAVYGEPKQVPISEGDAKVPTSPYGETKLAIERMLAWCHQAYGLKSVSLRYFNAAGAHSTLAIGEDHHPETHLIPIVLQTALKQRESVQVYGRDYPTEDGTCIRDYIHVMDLASAHRLAVGRLRNGGGAEAYNLGIGLGFSVAQVLKTARDVTGSPILTTDGPRRWGDPAVLVASSEQAQNALGWQPRYTSLEDIVASAWRWHHAHPDGFTTTSGRA